MHKITHTDHVTRHRTNQRLPDVVSTSILALGLRPGRQELEVLLRLHTKTLSSKAEQKATAAHSRVSPTLSFCQYISTRCRIALLCPLTLPEEEQQQWPCSWRVTGAASLTAHTQTQRATWHTFSIWSGCKRSLGSLRFGRKDSDSRSAFAGAACFELMSSLVVI